jgi:hypothetical protein
VKHSGRQDFKSLYTPAKTLNTASTMMLYFYASVLALSAPMHSFIDAHSKPATLSFIGIYDRSIIKTSAPFPAAFQSCSGIKQYFFLND